MGLSLNDLVSDGGSYNANKDRLTFGLSQAEVAGDMSWNEGLEALAGGATPGPLPPGTVTLFGLSVTPETPDFNDGTPITVGTLIRPKVNGTITHIVYWKASSTNNGVYQVALFGNVSGALLGSGSHTPDDARGWKVCPLGTPVAVTAETIYVAAVYSESGMYGLTPDLFLNTYVTDDLWGEASDDDERGYGNGRFAYSVAGYPDQSFDRTCYFVDVGFVPGGV